MARKVCPTRCTARALLRPSPQVRELVLFSFLLYADLGRMMDLLLTSFYVEDDRSHTQTSKKVYFRWLNIQPMRLLISCRSVAGGKGLEGFMANAPSGAIGLLRTAGALLTNVDRMPIKLKALVLDNWFAPPGHLISALGASYKEQLLSQLYKVILSFEMLGNPRDFWKRMATGVTDAFYEPLNGIIEGPEAFAEGVLRGGR